MIRVHHSESHKRDTLRDLYEAQYKEFPSDTHFIQVTNSGVLLVCNSDDMKVVAAFASGTWSHAEVV